MKNFYFSLLGFTIVTISTAIPILTSEAIVWEPNVLDPYIQCSENKDIWEDDCEEKYDMCSYRFDDEEFSQCLRNYGFYDSPCSNTAEDTFDVCKNKADEYCIERCVSTNDDDCINICAKDLNSCSQKCSDSLFSQYFDTLSIFAFEKAKQDRNKANTYGNCIDSCMAKATALINCPISTNSHNEDNDPYKDCVCNEGYVEGADGKCVSVSIDCAVNEHEENLICQCNDGFEKINGICVKKQIPEISPEGNSVETLNKENSNSNSLNFADVTSSHKNKIAIEYLRENNILSGYADGTFKPANAVNRAELLKILIESKEKNFTASEYDQNCFSDVPAGQWFTPYVCYAKERNWVNGYQNGTFRPAQTVSKAEAVKIVLNAFGFSIPETATQLYFSDVNPEDWFAAYIEKAKESDFLEEVSPLYEPNSGMTRAGISELIYRVLQFIN